MTRLPGFVALVCSILLVFAATTILPVEAEAKAKHRTSRKAGKAKKKKRFARSRSRCTPAARAEGKRQAIELVRTQSPQLCRMVGIEPSASAGDRAQALQLIMADGEDESVSIDPALAGVDEGEDLAELEREDDVTVDLEAFRSLWLGFADGEDGGDITECGVERQKIVDVVMDWLGTRYHFGGAARTGIDCSAFTRMMYASVANMELPRTAATQWSVGRPISRRADLKFGDLVFFHTRRHAHVSHVGIYLGDNLFAHASSRYGVTISSLESTYYSKRLLGARRITELDVQRFAIGSDVSNH